MIDNLSLLDELFSGEPIGLCRGHLFDAEAAPKRPDFDFGRIDGMLLGLAIGDALGTPAKAWLRRTGSVATAKFATAWFTHLAGIGAATLRTIRSSPSGRSSI